MLRRKVAYKLSFICLPAAVFVTVFINVYFVLNKGAAKTLAKAAKNWSAQKAALVALGAAAGASVLTAVIIVPLLWRRLRLLREAADTEAAEKEAAAVRIEMSNADAAACDCADVSPAVPNGAPLVAADDMPPPSSTARYWRRALWRLRMLKPAASIQRGAMAARKAAMHGMDVDIHAAVEEDPIVAAIHANAELFDPHAEQARGRQRSTLDLRSLGR